MKAWKTAHNHCTRSGTESDTTGWETGRNHSQSLSHTVYNQKQYVWVENCTATVPSFSHNQQIKPSTKTLFKSKRHWKQGRDGGRCLGVCVGWVGGYLSLNLRSSCGFKNEPWLQKHVMSRDYHRAKLELFRLNWTVYEQNSTVIICQVRNPLTIHYSHHMSSRTKHFEIHMVFVFLF